MKKEYYKATFILILFIAPLLVNQVNLYITPEFIDFKKKSEDSQIIITSIETRIESNSEFKNSKRDDNKLSSKNLNDPLGEIIIDAGPPPTFTETPNGAMMELGVDTLINYTISDNNPFEYTLYRDGIQVQSGPFQDGVQINHSIAGLDIGLYEFHMIAEDLDGKTREDFSNVTVFDGTVPTITETPSDIVIDDNTTGNILSWKAIDDHNETYTVKRNGSTYQTGQWLNDTQIDINVDGLIPGVHEFNMTFTDISSNNASDIAYVTVNDVTKPVLVQKSGNVTIEYGSTGNTIFWNITDPEPNNYTILRDAVVQQTGNWDNPTSITINIDGLVVGLYNYTLMVFDQSLNTYIDTQWVNVTDSTKPAITLSPSNKTYVESDNATSILLTWSATDLLPDIYEIYRNGSLVAFNSWTSGEEINFLDDRGWGVWKYTILFYDEENNIGSHTVYITVLDTTDPKITFKSDDITYAVGTTGHEIEWAADDLNPNNYQIYLDGIAQTDSGSSGTWFANQSIPVGGYSVDGLASGTYNYTIVFWDKSNNWVQSTIMVTVSDEPAITDSPGDFSYIEGDTGNDLVWIVSDSDPDYYKILDNDSIVVKEGNWVPNSNITWNVDGLSIGNYYYTLWVNDSGNNIVTDTSWVQVVDVPVLVSSPDDIPDQLTYSEGSTGNKLSWNFTDSFPANFELYRNNSGPLAITNGILVDTGSWTNADHINITGVAIDGLLKGSYNFTIIVYDQNDNTGTSRSLSDWIILTVTDDTPPILNSRTPSIGNNLTYSEGDTGNVLIWNADDNYPDTYKIFREMDQGNPVLEGTWTSAEDISINVDGELKGTYNYTIVFYDKSGNTLVNTIWVEVLDTTKPQFDDYSKDFSVNIGETGVKIFFIATEVYPTVYNITRNGTLVEPDTSYSGDGSTRYNYTLDTATLEILGFGFYNYTIGLFDESGLSNYVTILVLFKEPDPPQIVESPESNESYSEGVSSIIFTWNATDVHPDVYFLYSNETGTIQQIDSNTWTNASEVTRDVGGLSTGIYNYTIIFVDDYGNQIVFTTILTVIDDTDPTIEIQPSPFSFSEGSAGNELIWQANDTNPSSYKIYENSTTPVMESNWQSFTDVIYNLDHLTLGEWNITIQFFDVSGNNVTHTVIIDVFDDTPPELDLSPQDYTYTEGESGNFLTYRAIDNHPDYYDLYKNNSFEFSNNWDNDSNFQISIDGLKVGVYNYTVVFFDTSGNLVRSVVIVTVEDPDSPVLISEPTYDPIISEGSSGNEIRFTADDVYPDQYDLQINGSSYKTGQWFAQLETVINIDGLLKAEYEMTLIIYDDWGNFVSRSFSLSVIDTTKPTINSSPEDFTYEEDSGGFTVNWTVTDNYPNYYQILLDGENIKTANWESNSAILFTVNNLQWRGQDDYNYTILIYDDSGNLIVDSLFVSVIDTKEPEILSNPSNQIGKESILSNSTGNFLLWEVYDNHPGTYIISRDNKDGQPGLWGNNLPISFSLDDLPNGNYTFTIQIHDQSDNVITDTVYINIKDPETVLTKKPKIPIHREVHNGDVEIINVTWYNIDDRPINNALVTIQLLRGEQIVYGNAITNNESIFEITLDYSSSDLTPGSYVWVFTFTKDFYDPQEIRIPVEIKPHKVIIEIDHGKELIRGQPYIISATVTYNNEISDNVSLHLSQFKSLTGPVKGMEITFTITVFLLNGETRIHPKTAITNEFGVAKAQLESTETIDINSIQSISAVLSDSLFETTEESANNLATISVTDRSNPISVILDLLREYYMIILGVLGLIGLITYLLVRKKRKRMKFVNELMKDIVLAEAELNAIKTIQGVIIQHESGLPLYEYQVGRLSIDSILISGLSSAINSFLNELDREETFGFDIIERQSISITSHKMAKSNFIVVSTARLPLIILDQIKRVHQDMDKDFMDSFEFQASGYDELPTEKVENVFVEEEFKIHLTGELGIDSRKFQSLYRLKALSRILRQKLVYIEEFSEEIEAKTFYIEDLIDYLKEKELSFSNIARLIILIYRYDVIQVYPLDYSNNFTQ